MKNKNVRLILILLVVALALWVDLSNNLVISNPFNGNILSERNVTTSLGLDLRGGQQVVLEAVLPEGTSVTAEQMEVARTIIENRTNALGVSENVVQVAGETRIVGEFPGATQDEAAAILDIIQQTGQLEFVELGTNRLAEGTIIETYTSDTPPAGMESAYRTIMTGSDLETVGVTTQQLTGELVVSFTLSPEGSAGLQNAITIFKDYVKSETLAVELNTDIPETTTDSITEEFEGEKVRISITKV